MLHPAGQLGLRLGPQRGLAVDARRLTTSVDLRDPPNTQQSVRAGPQHQPLQTTDPLQVPFPRRREDPLPQTSYVLLDPIPVQLVPVGKVVLRSVHHDLCRGVQLARRFQHHRHRHLHRLTRPASAPFRPRHQPLSGQLIQTPAGSTVIGSGVPAAFRLPAFASRVIPIPPGGRRSSQSAHRSQALSCAGPCRGYHVPHTQDATGLGALSTPGRRCSPGWIALSSAGACASQRPALLLNLLTQPTAGPHDDEATSRVHSRSPARSFPHP